VSGELAKQTDPANSGGGDSAPEQPEVTTVASPAPGAPLGPDPQASTGAARTDFRELPMARFISIAALLLAIVVIGVLFFRVMASFFVPLFMAALLVVIFRPLYNAFYKRYDGRPRLCSILTTTSILLLVLLPAGLLGTIAVAQSFDFIRMIRGVAIYESVERVRERMSLQLPQKDEIRELETALESLSVPGPIEPLHQRIEEAERLITRLTELLGDPEDLPFIHKEPDSVPSDSLADTNDSAAAPDDSAAVTDEPEASPDDSLAGSDDAESTILAAVPLVPAERLLDDLEALKKIGEQWARSRAATDSLARQKARSEYETQFWQVQNAREKWIRSLIGGTLVGKLRLLVNPSDSELRSMVSDLQQYIQPRVLPFTQLAGRFLFHLLIQFGILVIAVYFFFSDGPGMVNSLVRLSPLDETYMHRLLVQFDQTSRAVVLATVLSALSQGALATVGYWLCGLGSLVMLFLATTFMALVPLLGPAVVWGPVSFYLGVVEGRWAAAIALIVFGLTVVSTIDNVVKISVLQGKSQLHPLLALLSVLGGLQVFGPIGLLVGPMIVAFMQTLLEILNQERLGIRGDIVAVDPGLIVPASESG